MKIGSKFWALLGAALLTFTLFGIALAATGASTAGVTPTTIDGNITASGDGNNDGADCALADAIELGDSNDSGTSANGVTVTQTYDANTKAVSFTATGGVVLIAYIKGSDSYNVYDYGAGIAADSNLFAPDNGSDGPSGLSHTVYCTGQAAQPSPSGGGAGESDIPSTPPSTPPSAPPSAPASEAPSASPGGGGAGATDVPTQAPTDTDHGLVSSPADGAWLLVVALGVLLGSVVVLTPARAKRRR
jgi:hypothetical protein